jgi:hypothetical protein
MPGPRFRWCPDRRQWVQHLGMFMGGVVVELVDRGLPASLTITGAGEIADSHRWDSSLKIRFARDSPLEDRGFELPVPPEEG